MNKEIVVLLTTWGAKQDDFKIATYLLGQLDVPVVIGFNGMSAQTVLDNCRCPIMGLAGCHAEIGKNYGDVSNTLAAFEICRTLKFKYIFKIVTDVYVFSLDYIYMTIRRMAKENIKVVSGVSALPWARFEEAHDRIKVIAADMMLFEAEYGLKLCRLVRDNRAIVGQSERGFFRFIETGVYRHDFLRRDFQNGNITNSHAIVHSHNFSEKILHLNRFGHHFLDDVAEEDFNSGKIDIIPSRDSRESQNATNSL